VQVFELFSDVKGVLFDVDGTLVDTLEMIVSGLGDSYEHFLGTRPSDEVLAGMMGVALKEQMDYFGLDQATSSTNAERCSYTIDQYRKHSAKQSLFTDAVEALALAERLGVRTALVTSRNSQELGDLFHDFPVVRQASAFVCSSDVPLPKPAADSALLACNLLSIQPSEALFVGDSLFDLGCARNAGCRFIGVAYGAGKREALIANNPDHLVETPAELLQLFDLNLIPCEPNQPEKSQPMLSNPS
jgi:pyrophosphatase PpaX